MAKLTFIEKDYFEELLGMGSGYILDFSNRTFQEFVYEIIGIDIYIKYHTDEALKSFGLGRTVDIVLMTVQELAILLSQKKNFKDFVWCKVRALAEEGDFYKSIFEMK